MNVIVSYGVVVLDGREKVLLVRQLEKAGHITGTYGLPAGRPEEGESPEETAQRELEEETGLKVEIGDLARLPTVYTADIPRSDGTIKRMSIECFLATKTTGEAETDHDETEPEWVSITNLDTLNLLPNIKSIIEDALNTMI